MNQTGQAVSELRAEPLGQLDHAVEVDPGVDAFLLQR